MSHSSKGTVAVIFVATMMLISGLAMTVGSLSAQATSGTQGAAGAPASVLPSAPQNLAVDQGDGILWIWWDHPVSQGSELIKTYTLYKGDSPGSLSPIEPNFDVGIGFYQDEDVSNGGTYYYQINANSDAGEGPLSGIVSGTPTSGGVMPGAPQNLLAENLVDHVRLTWSAPLSDGSAPIRYYDIFRGPNYFAPMATVDADTFEYIDDFVYAGLSYSYTVRARTVVGDGPQSPIVPVNVGGTGTIPSAPEYLSAYPYDGSVQLIWGMPSNPSAGGVLQFDIYRGSSSGTEILIKSITREDPSFYFNMYEDHPLTNDFMYWYFVKAVGTGGSSAPSNEVFAVPSQVGVKPDPVSISGAWAGNGQVIVSFYPSFYISGYVVNITHIQIFRSTESGVMGIPIATVPYTVFLIWDNTTSNGMTYYYSAKAEWAGGWSDLSSQVSATPQATGPIPSAPTNLWANPHGFSVTLDIQADQAPTAPYVLGYDIYRSTTSGGPTTLIDTVWQYEYPTGALGYNDHTATLGTTYWYTVKAVGFYGTSGPSNEVHAFASYTGEVPDAPTGLSATAVGSSAHLTWSFPGYLGTANFIHFDVYVQSDSGEWVDTALVSGYPGTSPSTNDNYLDPGTYHYKVLAGNYYGESVFSNIATVTITGGTPPGPPTGLIATPGNAQVGLSWTAPSDTGSSAIDYYIVYRDGVDVAHPTGLSTTVTGLTNGVSYSFAIAAHNDAGTGEQSSAAVSTPRTTPSAPTGLIATPGNGQIGLSWTAPSNGGAAIDYYIVYKNGVDVAHPTGLSATVTGLTNGQEYAFTVAAHNVVGPGPQSSPVNATPQSLPGAPTDLNGAPGNHQVYLIWVAPADTGGYPILYYVVFQDGMDVAHPTGLSTTITGLTNGGTYNFNVAAHTSVGTGPNSNGVAFVPRTTPDAPTGLVATPGNGQVSLSWTAPANGGAAIDYYVVYKDSVDVGHPTLTSMIVTGLTNGQEYSFTVAAHNVAGFGAQSSAALATPRTTPGAPTNLIGVPGNTQVALSWNPPVNTGGSPIDFYIVYQNGTELPDHYTGLTATIINLQNGVLYSFTVAAHNAAGMGPASSAGSFTPRTVPDAPASLQATNGNAMSVLTWSEPANGGAVIDYYVVYKDDVAWPIHYTGLTATIFDLTNGVTYTFKVAAHNAAGMGTQSPPATATPFQPEAPSAPRNLAGVAGNAYVQLTWDAPTSNGTSPLSGYAVLRGTTPGDIYYLVDTVGPTVLAFNDTSVSNGQTYYYQVKAMNAVGSSPMSNTVTANPVGPMPPSAPRNLNGYGTPTYAVLNWTAPSSEGTTPILTYQIFRGISTGTMGMVGEVGAGVLTFNDTTVSSDAAYYYKVRAVNSIGGGEFSNVVSISTEVPQAPSAPRSLSAEAGNGFVKLEWQVPISPGTSPIIRYVIFRGFGPENITTQIGQVNVPTVEYNDTSVVNGATYYYTVKAVNAVGSSGPSNAVQANPTAPAVPGAPSGLEASGGVGQVNLTWNAASSQTPLTGYLIYRGLSEETIGTTPIATVSGTTLVYADASVTAGTPYYYKVKATNAAGTGPASGSAHATPTATAPGQPQNVAATPGPGKVTVSWTAPSSSGGSPITGYKVYRQLAGGSELLTTVGASTLSYADTTGTAGTTYTYYVVAVNAVGSGSASTSVSAAPQSNTSTDNTMLYVGIAIAIIAVIAILFLLMRKKKQ